MHKRITSKVPYLCNINTRTCHIPATIRKFVCSCRCAHIWYNLKNYVIQIRLIDGTPPPALLLWAEQLGFADSAPLDSLDRPTTVLKCTVKFVVLQVDADQITLFGILLCIR